MRTNRTAEAIAPVLLAVALTCGVASAQSAQLQGLITGRSGATMTVQAQGQGSTVVVLTPATQVQEASGLPHIRKKQLGMTALLVGGGNGSLVRGVLLLLGAGS